MFERACGGPQGADDTLNLGQGGDHVCVVSQEILRLIYVDVFCVFHVCLHLKNYYYLY